MPLLVTTFFLPKSCALSCKKSAEVCQLQPAQESSSNLDSSISKEMKNEAVANTSKDADQAALFD